MIYFIKLKYSLISFYQSVWLIMIGSAGKMSLLSLAGKSENRIRGHSKI